MNSLIKKIFGTLSELLSGTRWRAILTLGFIYITMITHWWLWGLLLIFWGVKDLISNETWLTEPVMKSREPLLFYLIVATWLVFGFYIISTPIIHLLR